MWISKKRLMQMEANINRLVYVQQKQHEALERMGVLLTTAAETIQQSIPHTSASGNEAQKQGKTRK